jgi:hypothetical protein
VKPLKAPLAICAFAATVGAWAQSPSSAPPTATPVAAAVTPAPDANDRLTKDAAAAERDRIKTAYQSDKDGCKSMKGDDKDVCEAQAKSKEKVALAQVKYRETGRESDRIAVSEARARADYDVAKEQCEAKPLGERHACKKDAKQAEKAALRDAKKGEHA